MQKRKILKNILLISGLGVLGSTIGISLSGCTKKANYDYVGNEWGTDWKGTISGRLFLSFNDKDYTCEIDYASYAYSAYNLVIPKKVTHLDHLYTITSIGSYAFNSSDKNNLLGTLTIPDSITLIDIGAFYGCSGLTGSLIIPNSVLMIRNEAFYGCSGLTGLILGNSVETIGNSAFSGCSGLTGSLIIPNSVLLIEFGAFYECSGLTGTLTIGSSLTSIGEEAFIGCAFTDISVNPDNQSYGLATNVGPAHVLVKKDAEGDCLLDYSNSENGVIQQLACGQLVVPDTTTIGSDLFSGCSGLTGLILGNSVETIGDDAFYGCSRLTGTLTIGSSLTSIGEEAFIGCAFTDISVNPDNQSYGLATNVGPAHVLVEKDAEGDCLLDYSNSENGVIQQLACGQLVVLDTTTIGSHLFSGCSGLTGLILGNSVETIEEYAFYGCSGLTGSLIIPNSVETIGDRAFGYTNFSEVVNSSDEFCVINSQGVDPTGKISKENPGFMISKSDIPTANGDDMNINNVVVALYDITIPESIDGHNVVSIGDDVQPDFDGPMAFALTSITTLNSSNVTEIFGGAFWNCPNLTQINLPLVESIHESAFEHTLLLERISIPKIVSLSHEAFEFDNWINYVEIDASINPDGEGMDIQEIFGGSGSEASGGKLHDVSTNGMYKNAWLITLCGFWNNLGWTWDN